jgi:hypothetical protein
MDLGDKNTGFGFGRLIKILMDKIFAKKLDLNKGKCPRKFARI